MSSLNKALSRAVVVAQLVERQLPKQEIRVPRFESFHQQILFAINCIEKTNAKMRGMYHFKKQHFHPTLCEWVNLIWPFLRGAAIAQWICLRLPSWVQVPITPSTLLSIYIWFLSCTLDKTKINKKRTGLAHLKNFIWPFFPLETNERARAPPVEIIHLFRVLVFT